MSAQSPKLLRQGQGVVPTFVGITLRTVEIICHRVELRLELVMRNVRMVNSANVEGTARGASVLQPDRQLCG